MSPRCMLTGCCFHVDMLSHRPADWLWAEVE